MEGCGNIQREGEERTITLDRELINIQEGGTSDFNQLINRPSYDGERMTGNTNIPEVPTAVSQLTNDSGYQTGDQVESTVQQAVGAVTDDLADEITAREQADTALNLAIGDETTARQLADTNLQGQIDAITASSDVKDIVGTKAELNNYDTSTLGNNDIIKVLQDESENNATTYYRWNTATQQFTLIGEEGPYYTKSQADTLLNAKQNTLTAGSNVQIAGDTISATDTTYTAGNGLDLTGTEFSADTTVLATQTDLAGKQNTLTAGTGIDITNDVISATGGASYTAGDGIDITNDVISATNTGLAKELTADDYNYPADNPTKVALWLLDDGVYSFDNLSVSVNANLGYASSGFAVVKKATQSTPSGDGVVLFVPNDRSLAQVVTQIKPNGSGSSLDKIVTLTANNLTTIVSGSALDARQGKVLADRIGDLSTLTTTDKTSAVAAINELAAGGGGPTVVQTTGTSTTDVMSQNAVSSMVFADPSTRYKIQIGANANTSSGPEAVAIGYNSLVERTYGVAVGRNARVRGGGYRGVALGFDAEAGGQGSVALGAGAQTYIQGSVNIGSVETSYGYNNSQYRLLTGLYDGQNDHDAVTVGQLNTAIAGAGAAEINSTDWSALWQ